MKKIMMLCSLLMVVSLSACETMQGLGKDLQKAGQAIEKKADE